MKITTHFFSKTIICLIAFILLISDINAQTPASSLHFANSRVRILDASGFPLGNSPRTIEAWIQVPSSLINSWVTVVFGYGPYPVRRPSHCYLTLNGGKLGLNTGIQNTDISIPAPQIYDNCWHHVAITYEPNVYPGNWQGRPVSKGELKAYVDGNYIGRKILPDQFPALETSPDFGASIGANTPSTNPILNWWHPGKIDELRIWSKTKTFAEINAQKDIELTGTEADLVSYYTFNQGFVNQPNPTETTLYDQAGNNDGELQGFALSGSFSNWANSDAGPTACSSAPPVPCYPEALCQNYTVEMDASGNIKLDASDIDNQSESCGGTFSISPQACFDVGPNIVTLHIAALSSNSSCTAEVTVEPYSGPTNRIDYDFCEGGPDPDLEAELMAESYYVPGASFNWYEDISNSQGSAISTPSLLADKNKRRFYWVAQTANGCEGPVRRMRVRIRKTSTVVFATPPAPSCSGVQVNLGPAISDSRNIATGFSIYDTDPDVGTPTPIGSISSGQNFYINLPAGTTTYYATATNNTGCQVTGNTSLSSLPSATLDPISNYVFDAGDAVNINFSSPNADYFFWVDLNSFNNPDIGIVGGSGLNSLVFTAQNNTATANTATIRVIAFKGSCAGQVIDFDITVNSSIPRLGIQAPQQRLLLTASNIEEGHIQLNWHLRYEYELTHFEVEKQQEPGEWHTVQEVSWEANKQNYQFIDVSDKIPQQAYRLKLVHADGRIVWSKAVEVTDTQIFEPSFLVYPNPSSGRFYVQTAYPIDEVWQLQIIDAMGRKIREVRFNGSNLAINISSQPTGQYLIILENQKGIRQIHKIVKQ